MSQRISYATALVALSLFACAAVAQQQQQQQQQQGQMAPEKQFLRTASIINQFDLRSSEIAHQKAQDPQVKELAQAAQQAHKQLGDQLKQVCQQMGVEVTTELPQFWQQEIQLLQQLQGEQLEKQYVSSLKATHAALVSKFEDWQEMAQDQQTKQLISKYLPVLRDHYQQTQQVAAATIGVQPSAIPAGGRIDQRQQNRGDMQR